MSTSTAITLLTSQASGFSSAVYDILVIVIPIAIGYFVWKFAWRKLKGSVK